MQDMEQIYTKYAVQVYKYLFRLGQRRAGLLSPPFVHNVQEMGSDIVHIMESNENY